MEDKDKNVLDSELVGSVAEPIAEVSFVETHERTSEYEMLEKKGIKDSCRKGNNRIPRRKMHSV